MGAGRTPVLERERRRLPAGFRHVVDHPQHGPLARHRRHRRRHAFAQCRSPHLVGRPELGQRGGAAVVGPKHAVELAEQGGAVDVRIDPHDAPRVAPGAVAPHVLGPELRLAHAAAPLDQAGARRPTGVGRDQRVEDAPQRFGPPDEAILQGCGQRAQVPTLAEGRRRGDGAAVAECPDRLVVEPLEPTGDRAGDERQARANLRRQLGGLVGPQERAAGHGRRQVRRHGVHPAGDGQRDGEVLELVGRRRRLAGAGAEGRQRDLVLVHAPRPREIRLVREHGDHPRTQEAVGDLLGEGAAGRDLALVEEHAVALGGQRIAQGAGGGPRGRSRIGHEDVEADRRARRGHHQAAALRRSSPGAPHKVRT